MRGNGSETKFFSLCRANQCKAPVFVFREYCMYVLMLGYFMFLVRERWGWREDEREREREGKKKGEGR